MTDKEKIIAEIERLKKELYKQRDFRIDGSPIPVYDTNAIDGMLKVLDEVKGFINSLPSAEEQPSEELEEASNKYANDHTGLCIENDGGLYEDFDKPKRDFIAGANWQKEQMIKSAVSIGYLQDWYQNSIDEEVPPIWTDEHLNELTKDFYLIPKQKEDEQ